MPTAAHLVKGHVVTREAAPPDSEDAAAGTLFVEEPRFAIVPEWVIDAAFSDGAFRLYSLLLRYGNGSGCRMPSRQTLARRLRRAVDAVDRAMRQLTEAGIVRVEHRRSGEQFLSNRYHVRTTAPAHTTTVDGGGRKCAATPLAQRCAAARQVLGKPTARWTARCLSVVIKLAVVTRGWPAASMEQALLAVAGDRDSRSPARVAEAGPWWDAATLGADQVLDAHELAAMEALLAETDGLRPALQAQARAELTAEGMPVIRATVARRACAILDIREAK